MTKEQSWSKNIETFESFERIYAKNENKHFWHFPESVFFANISHLSRICSGEGCSESTQNVAIWNNNLFVSKGVKNSKYYTDQHF